ncbi:MAG: hypothetical protein NWF03_07195 [Candidatus Bathyarchaeota archaeon]|nr:hypothetical protein [Candidatus Bathyarchaeota archaeon]
MTSPELKEFVDELRTEWKDLWRSRVEDKIRAEGIAKNDYSKLFVERGTVIMATRDYKPMEFFDIVQQYLQFDADKVVPINTTVGGWGKFVRDNIKKQKRQTKRTYTPPKPKRAKGQQQKNGGRGWRHTKLLDI